MSISALFILDLKGNVIASRNYRGDVEMSCIEKFMPMLVESEDEGRPSPVLQCGEISFTYIKHSNLFLISVSKRNHNVGMVLSFLYKLVEVSGNFVVAKSQFKRQSIANHVEVIIPVPSDAFSPKFKTSVGSAKYVPEIQAYVWTIRSFPGGREYLMRAHLELSSINSEEIDVKAPIQVKFEIPYYTTSVLQVRYLKIIEKSGYQALVWVRYVTQNGDYQLRMS